MASESARNIILPRVMLLNDLANTLGISHQTARKYLRNGVVPGVKIGGKWVISREALVDAIEKRSCFPFKIN